MTEKPVDLTAKGPARRRLLRGTFAAPVVMTLYSGRALAAASATCAAKAQLRPDIGELVIGDPTDTFRRVKLYQVTKTTGNPPVEEKTYWLAGASLPVGNTLGIGPDNFTRFLDSNELSADSSEKNKKNPPGDEPPTDDYQPARWVALRYDASGAVVGVGETGTGSALGESCWMSVFGK